MWRSKSSDGDAGGDGDGPAGPSIGFWGAAAAFAAPLLHLTHPPPIGGGQLLPSLPPASTHPPVCALQRAAACSTGGCWAALGHCLIRGAAARVVAYRRRGLCYCICMQRPPPPPHASMPAGICLFLVH